MKDVSQVRQEAEALAMALEYGICQVTEVVSWSDALILREGDASFPLCDISLSQDRHPLDVAGLLRQFPGKPIQSQVQVLLVILFRDKVKHHPELWDKVASALFQMSVANEIVDTSLKSIAWWAWDALHLAEEGIVQESRETIAGQMLSAFDEVIAKCDVRWSA